MATSAESTASASRPFGLRAYVVDKAVSTGGTHWLVFRSTIDNGIDLVGMFGGER